MEVIRAFLHRILGKNIAGVLGIVGTVIPLAKEVVVGIIRLVAVFAPGLEQYVDKVTGIFIIIEKVWDNIKRFFLGLPPGPVTPTPVV